MSATSAIQQPTRPRWSIRPHTILYSLCCLLIVAVLAFATLQPFQVLPRIALSPGFALVDQAGRQVTSEDLRGHIVLYHFGYAGCRAPCPPTGQVMRTVQEGLADLKTAELPVMLVTVSFDPVQDAPEQLGAFAAALGADAAHWRVLGGDAGRLKQVIGGGFGIYYAAQADGTFDFDPTFVLVDGAGIVRARYRTATPALATLKRDIELVAKEAEQSQGAMRLAYEAAHLFLCYPQ